VLARVGLTLWGAKQGNQGFHYRLGAPLHHSLDHALERGEGVGSSLILGALGPLRAITAGRKARSTRLLVGSMLGPSRKRSNSPAGGSTPALSVDAGYRGLQGPRPQQVAEGKPYLPCPGRKVGHLPGLMLLPQVHSHPEQHLGVLPQLLGPALFLL
jgi:hypothetical protein